MHVTDPDFPPLVSIAEEEQTRLGRSYCGNSDVFIHGAFDTPRDLPDEFYKATAKFFK